jgi:hypothetical protein
VHTTSSGVLNVGAVPGDTHGVLTQGRDGTLKRWQARGAGGEWSAYSDTHAACATQLLPDGLSTQPTAVMDTQSYSFCRFAAGAGALPPEGGDGCNATTSTSLVTVAGSDPAAVELWDVNAGESCVDVVISLRCQALSRLPC